MLDHKYNFVGFMFAKKFTRKKTTYSEQLLKYLRDMLQLYQLKRTDSINTQEVPTKPFEVMCAIIFTQKANQPGVN